MPLTLEESKSWHKQFAHPHTAALISLIEGYKYNRKVCEMCVLAKHQRKMIQILVIHMTTPFELEQLDTCCWNIEINSVTAPDHRLPTWKLGNAALQSARMRRYIVPE